jgi:uncharacterized membrane protein YdfJ with MMPL/SSD domain
MGKLRVDRWIRWIFKQRGLIVIVWAALVIVSLSALPDLQAIVRQTGNAPLSQDFEQSSQAGVRRTDGDSILTKSVLPGIE